MAAVSWGSLTPQEKSTVTTEVSAHQRPGSPTRYELVSRDIPERETGIVFVIVGCLTNPFEEPTAENAVVYTWHPGEPVPMIDVDPDATAPQNIAKIDPRATVKLER